PCRALPNRLLAHRVDTRIAPSKAHTHTHTHTLIAPSQEQTDRHEAPGTSKLIRYSLINASTGQLIDTSIVFETRHISVTSDGGRRPGAHQFRSVPHQNRAVRIEARASTEQWRGTVTPLRSHSPR